MAGLRKPSKPSPRPGQEHVDPLTGEPAPGPEPGQSEEPRVPEAPAAEQAAEAGVTEPAAEPGHARPSPRRKSRDGGSPKPASEEDIADVAEAPSGPPPPPPDARSAATRSRRARYGLTAALLVLALVFAGLGVFFKLKHGEITSATSNTALVDVATTAKVKEEMSTAAERLFSIDYNNLGKTKKAAEELLVNDEVRQKYEALMGEVERLAPQQKIVVTVKATRSAVVLLDDDRAKVMVYIDQTATRTDKNQTSAGGAAMWLITEKRDGQWKVVDMDTYNSGQPTPAPAPGGGQPSAPPPGK